MPFFTYTLAASLFMSLGGLLYGFDSGVITPVLVMPAFKAAFNNPTPAQRGAIVACFAGGAFIGSFGVGLLSDRLGRRKTMFIGSIFGMLGGAIMTAGSHIATLVVGRLLLGVCTGLITGTAPVFASEIAKTEERGRISAAQQLMIAFGFLTANWTGYGFKGFANNYAWRGPFALQILPALVLSCGIFLFPESPRWLMLVDRPVEARKSLMRYHGNDETYVDAEFEKIRIHVEAEKLVQKTGFRAAMSTPSKRRRLALGAGVWVFAMLSGISFIQYFSPSIYATLNFSTDRILLVTGLYGSMAPIFVMLALFLVDRVGRVTLLTFASFTLAILYSIITALSAVYPAIPGQPVNAAAQYTIVAAVFAISCTFSATFGPLGWVVPPEMFQTSQRGVGNSLVHVCHYAFSILVSQASPVGLAKVGWRYYILFICTNTVAGFVFFFCYPETRGKSLEEIDQIFGDDAVEEAEASGIKLHHGRVDSVRSDRDKSSV